MSKPPRERCPSCGRPVRSLQIDDTEQRVLVSGKPIAVALAMPGLQGFVVDFASRVHRCQRRRAARTPEPR